MGDLARKSLAAPRRWYDLLRCVESSSSCLVGIDEAVDGPMGDTLSPFSPHSSGDLFRRPLHFQLRTDIMFDRRGDDGMFMFMAVTQPCSILADSGSQCPCAFRLLRSSRLMVEGETPNSNAISFCLYPSLRQADIWYRSFRVNWV